MPHINDKVTHTYTHRKKHVVLTFRLMKLYHESKSIQQPAANSNDNVIPFPNFRSCPFVRSFSRSSVHPSIRLFNVNEALFVCISEWNQINANSQVQEKEKNDEGHSCYSYFVGPSNCLLSCHHIAIQTLFWLFQRQLITRSLAARQGKRLNFT